MIPKNNCLECNAIIWDDRIDRHPKPGFFGICGYCGSVFIFDKNLKFKKPKRIPIEIAIKSCEIKDAIANGFNVDQMMKDELMRKGELKLN